MLYKHWVLWSGDFAWASTWKGGRALITQSGTKSLIHEAQQRHKGRRNSTFLRLRAAAAAVPAAAAAAAATATAATV